MPVMRYQEPEEFLQPEEQQGMEGTPESKPVCGQVVAEFKGTQDAVNVLAQISNEGMKYRIVNDGWTPFAVGMWERFDQLRGCNPDTILFLMVDEGRPKYRGKPKIMETTVISKRWQEILYQLKGLRFTHCITIYGGNVDKYDQNHQQLLVHLYNAMRMIREDGSLRSYDISSFTEVYASLSVGWDKEGQVLPDLLDVGNWARMHKMQGQLFEDRSGENALAKDF